MVECSTTVHIFSGLGFINHTLFIYTVWPIGCQLYKIFLTEKSHNVAQKPIRRKNWEVQAQTVITNKEMCVYGL